MTLSPIRSVLLAMLVLTSAIIGGATSAADTPDGRSQHPAGGSDWPQFLGPQRNGHSTEENLNLDWTRRKPPLLWRVPLGKGFSSPIVVGERLYVTASKDGKDYVVCYNANTGNGIWFRELGTTFLDRQRQGAGPRSTPTYHDGLLYCLQPEGDLFCLQSSTGDVVWKTNVIRQANGDNPGKKTEYYWGLSGSPLIEANLVIVPSAGNRDNAFVACDRTDGHIVWSVGTDPPGYASPIMITVADQRQIIGFTGQSLMAISPTDGKQLWRFPWGNQYNCNCATPLIDGETLLISSAYGTGVSQLLVQAEGQSSGVIPLWSNKNLQNQFATSMIVDGHVYGPHGDNAGVTFRCLELQTGDRSWVAREPGKCTMIEAAGHLICQVESGDLVLVKADPKSYTERGRVAGLLHDKAWAPPALSRGRLYSRDQQELICLDLRQP